MRANLPTEEQHDVGSYAESVLGKSRQQDVRRVHPVSKPEPIAAGASLRQTRLNVAVGAHAPRGRRC